ncbi:UNVERIFIED_CONTAM: hypothetical protein Slati_3122400 [Sesamum latifolium]|uniref:Uncharacterized protein n=1 Tax=Sesamum latifolium TaxID=2727402 RepID=A0AAW2UVN4_9LAMI
MAANNQQFNSRNENPPQKVNEETLNKSKLVAYVPLWVTPPTLVLRSKKEPTIHANAIGEFSGPSQRGHDPFFNTYNPGWRDHPNLRYCNQPQNFQRGPYPTTTTTTTSSI